MSPSLFSISGAVAACLVLAAISPHASAAEEPVGREDELQARYLKQAEFLRRMEPSASFRLHRSLKQPVTFLWYETYPSQEAPESHLKVAMPALRKEFGPTHEGLIARPSDSDTYQELAKP